MNKPKCKLVGENGNIYNLISIAQRTLRRNGLHEQATEMAEKVCQSKSYSQALCIIMDYVDVDEDEGEV
jgi:hypothetical protein